MVYIYWSNRLIRQLDCFLALDSVFRRCLDNTIVNTFIEGYLNSNSFVFGLFFGGFLIDSWRVFDFELEAVTERLWNFQLGLLEMDIENGVRLDLQRLQDGFFAFGQFTEHK